MSTALWLNSISLRFFRNAALLRSACGALSTHAHTPMHGGSRIHRQRGITRQNEASLPLRCRRAADANALWLLFFGLLARLFGFQLCRLWTFAEISHAMRLQFLQTLSYVRSCLFSLALARNITKNNNNNSRNIPVS